jgi:hypothetical protein
MTMIVICGVAAIVCSATMALAMSRAAGQADEDLDRMLARHLRADRAPGPRYVAGWDRAQATISFEPSTTVPSSRRRVGTQRLPVSSSTSRRPRVWLKGPGSSPRP